MVDLSLDKLHKLKALYSKFPVRQLLRIRYKHCKHLVKLIDQGIMLNTGCERLEFVTLMSNGNIYEPQDMLRSVDSHYGWSFPFRNNC